MFNSVWCITFKSNKYEVAKYPGRLKSWQKWRAKEAKSKSIWKSKSVDLRLDFTSTIHYHHDLVIIKPMGLIEVQIIKYLQIVSKSSFWQFFWPVTTRYYIINQKIIEKSQDVKLVKIKHCYWLRSFWFIIQGLKFSQTSTFCKMLVKNNIKKTFSEKANNAASAISPLFSNIADKPDFSTKKTGSVTFIPLPFR